MAAAQTGFNITFFIDTLPTEFDQWSVSVRLDFYQDYLDGFLEIAIQTQQMIAREYSFKELNDIFDLLSVSNLVDGAFELSQNATDIFLYYISNPEEIFELIPTEAPTTIDPDVLKCLDPDKASRDVVPAMLAPAILAVIILSFLSVRKNLCKAWCWGRPAVVYPVNFIDEHSRRYAYASAFVLISYKALMLFEGEVFWDIDTKNCSFCGVFVNILNVFGMCIVYYPLLACLSLRKNIIANIIGILYLVPWVYFSVGYQLRCPVWRKYDTQDITERAVRITAILQACFDVPILIAYVVLVATYFYDLFINIYTLYLKAHRVDTYKARKERKLLKTSLEVQYVQALFKRKETKPEGKLQTIKSLFVYSKIEGFKYSPRMVCTLAVAIMVLFKGAAEIAGYVDYWYTVGADILKDLEEADDGTDDVVNGTLADWDYYNQLLDVARWSIHASNILSAVIHLLSMIQMSIMYRKHLRKYFRGRRTWHFKHQPSPSSSLIAGMRYSGYQVAFLLYGYIILGFLLTAVCVAIALLCILPWMDGKLGPALGLLIGLWPGIVVALGVYFIQMMLAKFVFLQDFGAYLALNNIHVYHATTFFLFFFNIIMGLFTALKRVLFSMVFGTLLLARLDRCLLMRGVESLDTGFKAYLGMLEVDCTHNHPVMKAFIQLLWSLNAQKQLEEASLPTIAVISTGVNGGDKISEANGVVDIKEGTKVERRHPKWRNKWWKAVTLYNNPSLTLDLIKQDMHKNLKNVENRRKVIDTATDVAAITVGVATFQSTVL